MVLVSLVSHFISGEDQVLHVILDAPTVSDMSIHSSAVSVTAVALEFQSETKSHVLGDKQTILGECPAHSACNPYARDVHHNLQHASRVRNVAAERDGVWGCGVYLDGGAGMRSVEADV